MADLQDDIGRLLEDINYYDDTYGTIPGDAPLMDQILQAGRTLCDAAQDHDQAWIAEQEREATHQLYIDKMIMGREMRDMG